MKTNLVNLVLGLAFTAGTVSCQSQKNNLVFEHQGGYSHYRAYCSFR